MVKPAPILKSGYLHQREIVLANVNAQRQDYRFKQKIVPTAYAALGVLEGYVDANVADLGVWLGSPEQ